MPAARGGGGTRRGPWPRLLVGVDAWCAVAGQSGCPETAGTAGSAVAPEGVRRAQRLRAAAAAADAAHGADTGAAGATVSAVAGRGYNVVGLDPAVGNEPSDTSGAAITAAVTARTA